MGCLRLLFGDDSYFVESDCNTWNIVCEITPKNPEVKILADVILAPRRDLRLCALNALPNEPNRHFRNLETVHITAISSIRTKGIQRFRCGILLNSCR